MNMDLDPIHPFPARMAPELVRQSLEAIPKGGRVLDPMCGSGTVTRAAAQAGFDCAGIDIDPLAVLMARVWSTPMDASLLRPAAEKIVADAEALPPDDAERAPDVETQQFISFWFAPEQEEALRRLATVLRRYDDERTRDALIVALSRIIVSKEKMASLARDTSHSRPHRVPGPNDFDVYGGFVRSADRVAKRLRPEAIKVPAKVRRGDARRLDDIGERRFDLVLTSPPYLNAIDYLRGHRLTLVWLGFGVGLLRGIRATSIGTERMAAEARGPVEISRFIKPGGERTMGRKHEGWIRRYAADMEAVLRQIARVVKKDGLVVMVLGNSFLRGSVVDNAGLIRALAESVGLRERQCESREIPARRRYLPPPGDGRNALDRRMRTETVITFDMR